MWSTRVPVGREDPVTSTMQFEAQASAATVVEDSDRELIARFLAGDQSAFAAVVQRHTGLVISTCQRVLNAPSDVEDAFQATFFVLARRAKSLAWEESVAGWLYQTARRTSLKLRSMTLRRQQVEGQVVKNLSVGAAPSASEQASVREIAEILDNELERLSPRFREVILLSQIEGLSRDEIAARLRISLPVVKDRLERGREQLRARLLRRGVTLTAGLISTWLYPSLSHAALTTTTSATAQAAMTFVPGTLAAGSLSTPALLAQGVLKMMGLEKLKSLAICLVSLLTVGGIALGMLQDNPQRFEKGLRGRVIAVNQGRPQTITVMLDEFNTALSLDVAASAKVWVAFESSSFQSVVEGQYVSVHLGDDHRTVNDVHVLGSQREVAIQSIAPSGAMMVVPVVDDDDEEAVAKPEEVRLAQDAILRIGGLPANRNDLRPGMRVPLEMSGNGNLVNAIEADTELMITAQLLHVDVLGETIRVRIEEDEEPASELSLKVLPDTSMTVEGKPVKLADLKPGSEVVIRLSEGRDLVRAMRATMPDDEGDNE